MTQILRSGYLACGDPARLRIHPSANVVNTWFNTSSGVIEIGTFSFMGHIVFILTGSHDYRAFLESRQHAVPAFGHDVIVGRGYGSGQGPFYWVRAR